MKFISNHTQLMRNIRQLSSHLQGAPIEAEFARDRIRLGVCFVVTTLGRVPFFAPSRFIGYRPIFFVTLLASVLALAAPFAAAAEVNPALLVQRHVEAIARGDVAAALALYNDDAVLQGGIVCTAAPCVGKGAIQKELEHRVAVKDRATIIRKYVSGNVAAIQLELRTDTIQKAGVDRIIIWGIYEVKGDKIAYATTVLQRTDPQTARFFEWRRAQPPAR